MPGPHTVAYGQNATPDIVRVHRRYRVGKPLGFGAFGTFIIRPYIKTERDVALKLEVARDPSSKLAHEYSIYQAILGLPRISKVYWYGREGQYHVIVLDHLGSTFKKMTQMSMLDTNAIFMYAMQMLSILESLHNRHYVHLDVKPDNFALGLGKSSNQVFLIDFGLTQLFRNPATHSHIAQTKGSSTIGTIHYSSINCHLGLTPSQHNDLESLIYVIVYLVKGSLPWQGIIVQPGQIHQDEVLRVKQMITVKALCRALPQPFVEFVEHIQCLGFWDKPDYNYLYSILKTCVVLPTLPNSN
ncbi:kinase-like domain-containing protein [Russula dissimulans]|nr:kinase-like domain-containing protein [Russula dissimulans]